ncbi:Cysteine synthase [Vibrio ruber DSM 16370]|uniref:Cysteine synthase n=1 Tax=Vibrio ruber (strain DSM 16370 / JCM 11486 / BCRC 17186 / CECT 7878 / LMG 23124 / VR1) TaxID=1123498 RepID=A0A1R4LRP6_VIBR1|nr:PLP-dependent cysteine synthase family protein [Vibrio ruber]SJN59272.1 Cysteine synthase [Vibrio ruber DSM 16370]
MTSHHSWIKQAIHQIMAEEAHHPETPLIKLTVPGLQNIDIYLKDESRHPTGSLKHRLARSLFLYALTNGLIGPDTPIIESSSGSTAISEAYFAQMLGLPFYAVMPRTTARKKIELIEQYGGTAHFVDRSCDIYPAARQLAETLNGHYIDQFTYAERASDWRGTDNVAHAIFAQMAQERFPLPRWLVMSAGTGGTSATLGRHIHYRQYPTQLCVADCDNSVFYDAFLHNNSQLTCQQSSRIEGIGRPRVEPSFIPGVIDTMIAVPDAASIATIYWLEQQTGRKAGPSTGTNLYATLQLARQMQRNGETGSLVTLWCDDGERYLDCYYNPAWVEQHIGSIAPYLAQLDSFELNGNFFEEQQSKITSVPEYQVEI